MTEDRAITTDRLSTALRAWLRTHDEPTEVLAGALVYELAALIARDAPSIVAGVDLVDRWAAVMKSQIAMFGVRREHP
jgi:hypothetical protein